MFLEFKKDNYTISNNKEQLDRNAIHQLLLSTYWGEGIPFDIMCRSIDNSECFGLYEDSRQIGFLRIISDWTTFAYLSDFVIAESKRRIGLGKWMMQCIMKRSELDEMRLILLATKDAHEFYTRYGFCPLEDSGRFMEIFRPSIYRQLI